LACTRRLHAEGDKGITRKYRNPETPLTRRKIFVATQKQYLWDGCIRPTHRKDWCGRTLYISGCVIRIVARSFSIGGLCVYARGLDILKIDEKSADL